MLGAVYIGDPNNGHEFFSGITQAQNTGDDLSSEDMSERDLKLQQRICVILRYVWDFKNTEIGHCLGVSESRISQILSGIREDVQKILLEGVPKRSALSEDPKRKMESLFEEKTSGRPGMEQSPSNSMAEEQSGWVEAAYAPSFSQWLT